MSQTNSAISPPPQPVRQDTVIITQLSGICKYTLGLRLPEMVLFSSFPSEKRKVTTPLVGNAFPGYADLFHNVNDGTHMAIPIFFVKMRSIKTFQIEIGKGEF